MDTLTWILIGVVGFWAGALLLKQRGVLPSQIHVNGPIVTIHTQRGRALLERLATYRRFWRAWANVGIGMALVVMVASFLFLLTSALSVLQNPPQSGVTQPRNVLVIPGVNEFLPLSVAPEIIIALLVGLVVHEGGHGILCRVGDIDIDSMGVALFTFIPAGAFVQPDEESQQAADRGARTRMFAAGVTNNFAITLVAFLLLFGPVVGSLAVAPGAAVGETLPASAAAAAGIDRGDRITAIDGTAVGSNDDLEATLANTTDRNVTVELNGERERMVERSLLVTASTPSGPAAVDVGQTITRVNDSPVYTTAAFQRAITDREVVSVTLANNSTLQFPAGASVTVSEGGAIADTLPPGTQATIVQLDGERTPTGEALGDQLDDRAPGDSVSVTAYVDGVERTFSVTLAGSDDQAMLGVRVQPGTTGLDLDDFGTQYYPAETYLALLGGGQESAINPAVTDTFVGKTLFTLFLPVAGLVAGQVLPYNFPGFTGDIQNFFVIEGPLGFLGGGVFLLANILFWIGWLNINLGFFNCIPAFPLDGGHILRTSTEAVVSRLPIEGSYELTKLVTVTIGATMFASFFVVVFGPQLLG